MLLLDLCIITIVVFLVMVYSFAVDFSTIGLEIRIVCSSECCVSACMLSIFFFSLFFQIVSTLIKLLKSLLSCVVIGKNTWKFCSDRVLRSPSARYTPTFLLLPYSSGLIFVVSCHIKREKSTRTGTTFSAVGLGHYFYHFSFCFSVWW